MRMMVVVVEEYSDRICYFVEVEMEAGRSPAELEWSKIVQVAEVGEIGRFQMLIVEEGHIGKDCLMIAGLFAEEERIGKD